MLSSTETQLKLRVIVYAYPGYRCFGRKQVLPKISMKKPNQKLSVIMRVVVHPKYRTKGLGIKLIKETLPLAPTPCVESIAVMARYNPFLEKAGMQKIMESKPNPNVLVAIEEPRILGFSPVMLGSVNHNMKKSERLAGPKLNLF